MRQTPFGVWNRRTPRAAWRMSPPCNEADAFWRLEPASKTASSRGRRRTCNEADAFWRLEQIGLERVCRSGLSCNEADAFWRLEQHVLIRNQTFFTGSRMFFHEHPRRFQDSISQVENQPPKTANSRERGIPKTIRTSAFAQTAGPNPVTPPEHPLTAASLAVRAWRASSRPFRSPGLCL